MIALDMNNLTTALCCISGIPTSNNSEITPIIIKEAENALLSWENSNPSLHAIHLLQVIIQSPVSLSAPTSASTSNVVPRLASALTLKAMIGRKWKDRGRLSKKAKLILIDNDTKIQIRNIVLSLLTTGGVNGNYIQDHNLSISLIRDKVLMTTLASILSKIASFDIPLEFKELIPILIGYSIGGSSQHQHQPIDQCVTVETRLNTSNALEFILADLCKKRLLIYKKYIISISSTYLSDIVTKGLSYSMDHLEKSDVGQLPVILQYAIIMTKVVHHLILSSLSSLVDGSRQSATLSAGSENSDNNGNTAAKAIDHVFELLLGYIPSSCNHLRVMRCRHQGEVMGGEHVIEEKLKSLLGEFYMLVLSTQKIHPISFARFLNPFLTLFYSDLGKMVSSKDIEPLFAIPLMSFMANVISCSHYTPDEASNEAMDAWRSEFSGKDNNVRRAISSQGDVVTDPHSVSNAVQSVWTVFLTVERIHELVDASLFFMTLTESHLADWSDDPESYYSDRINAVADDDVISCAQNMYLALLESKCESIIVEKVSSFMLRVDDQIQTAYLEAGKQIGDDNYSSAVSWDAIYTVIGLSFESLKRCVGLDINNWLVSCISNVFQSLLEVQQTQVNRLPILRYRLVWLLECGFSHLNQCHFAVKILNAVLIDNSSAQNDSAVQLEAVQALSTMVYDPPENLISYLSQPDKLITSLYVLASELQEVENKTQPLTLIQLLLSTFMFSGQQIDANTMVATIVNPLERIWNTSVDEYLVLRSSVISILGCLAAFGKSHASKLHPIALPLLNHALDPTNDDNSFLVTDALDLWLTLLRIADSYDSNFCVIFSRIQELLLQDLEHVKKLMLIAEGYLLLGGITFWNKHFSSLETMLKLLVGNVSLRGAMYVNLVLEALLKSLPIEGASMLLSTGLVTKMLKSCVDTYADEQDCEPIGVINIYLSVFSRIMLVSPQSIDLIIHAETHNQFGVNQLIDLYFQQFNQNDPYRQKLWAMFLLTLQNVNGKNLLNTMNFNKVLRCCFTVLQEDAPLSAYSVPHDSEEENLNLQHDNYNYLMNAASKKDIVCSTEFRSFYLNAIQRFQAAMDITSYRSLMQSIDPNLTNQLEMIVRALLIN